MMTEKARLLDIISIGDANIDLIMRVPHHPNIHPKGDRGAAVRGQWYYLGPGGVAANVAAGMARLGNRVGFIGVIGDDEMGRNLRLSLSNMGIDIRYLRSVSGYQTSLTSCFESSEGQAVHYSCPGPTRISEACLEPEYLDGSRMLFLCGHIMTQNEETGGLLLEAMQQARRQGVVIALDPGKFWLNMDLASYVHKAVHEADILLPNAYEAELLSGCSQTRDVSRALLDQGVKVVAVKLGEAGCIVCTHDEEIEMPGFKTEVKSRLGAGDSFNSGFLHGYLRRWPLMKMARFANASASLKIRYPGTQAGLPTESEVEAFLAERTS
jgi:2-dehydro-3-deoxygluconokinase